jgi:hypothetical protein
MHRRTTQLVATAALTIAAALATTGTAHAQAGLPLPPALDQVVGGLVGGGQPADASSPLGGGQPGRR